MADNRITREYMSGIAKNMLDFFKSRNITQSEDLVEASGVYPLEKHEAITIGAKPSGLGTFAETVSYSAPDIGIPLEMRINENLGSSVIIAKSETPIPGYKKFATDPFGNIVQEKHPMTTKLSELKKELESL